MRDWSAAERPDRSGLRLDMSRTPLEIILLCNSHLASCFSRFHSLTRETHHATLTMTSTATKLQDILSVLSLFLEDAEDLDIDTAEFLERFETWYSSPNQSAPKKRKRSPSVSSSSASSSDDDSSDSDSDSDSDSSSDSEAEPPAKRSKVEKKVEKPVTSKDDDSSSASDSSSDASSESESDSSDSDSDSDSDSSDSDSAKEETQIPSASSSATMQAASSSSDSSSDDSSSSESSSEDEAPPPPKKSKGGKKAKENKKEAAKEEKKPAADISIPAAATTTGDMHPDRMARLPATKESVSNVKKQNVPFSRISADQKVDPRFTNEYVSYDYAEKAYQDLVVTKGKGFTKEKNKKKRGSYRGGAIDLTPKGIKFDD
ncbi:Hypothetical protein R9X50_00184500 [Acrodontium crateriforme]|uniref:Srp40 C-terminal domain-containing protein n=1 Tax=Acrodontium crateriforme TaxID=150365 RepID=A0AAQ3R857_9PEZI|nr:Hypothetical protein R9X50_00184500 [Acrodontium crateriforme]